MHGQTGRSRLASDTAWVPGLFWYEIRNLLLIGERRVRIGPGDVARFLAHLDGHGARLDLGQVQDVVDE